MPTIHNSTVDKTRAILIYAILHGMKMDVRNIIFSQIQFSASNAQNSYSFPQLITVLCRQARVPYTLDEALIQPGICLTIKYLDKLSMGKSARASKKKSALTSSSTTPLKDKDKILHAKMDAIQEYQHQQTAWMTKQFQVLFDMQRKHFERDRPDVSKFKLSS
ncbi:uncharacterized protein LOC116106899 [Pistacia vera]|uniref:uncharacterized protein LOC116106899 n=1 Tax=Pistacia vera TaxID=55513 RepID=UPI001263889E|nr:uncharacterized protein LOC116106899 [Pistacia vera]